jgi:hypothetical protein
MTLDPIRLITPGCYASTDGNPINFTADDLLDMAAAYDPGLFHSPIVANQPRHDDPAYGWIERLEFTAGALYAHAEQVEPTFGASVASGAYIKKAVSFFPPDYHINPTPGRAYLRHLAFKGIKAPAVPGLRPANFAAAPGLVFDLEPARVDFAIPTDSTPSAAGLAELMAAKTYAERHALSLVDAIKHMGDEQMEAMDEIRTYAREHGLSIAEAFILKGNI